MSSYRAYRLDKKKQIKSGCWIEAGSDQEAKHKAEELCDDTTSAVELWRAATRIDEIDCDKS